MMKDFGYIEGIAQEARITELSDDQAGAIEFARGFVESGSSARYAVIGGVAGSGKSTIIPHIIEAVGGTPFAYGCADQGDVAVCAYTGKAVMNLKRKGIPYACTLHAFLYDTRFEYDPVTGGTKAVYIPRPDFFFRRIRLSQRHTYLTAQGNCHSSRPARSSC